MTVQNFQNSVDSWVEFDDFSAAYIFVFIVDKIVLIGKYFLLCMVLRQSLPVNQEPVDGDIVKVCHII